ncbi:MAG TPA: pitrilysin family protein, partial [Terriglobales bacterium]|nr:pitrilysin family protein [Terriglobales bacterium]
MEHSPRASRLGAGAALALLTLAAAGPTNAPRAAATPMRGAAAVSRSAAGARATAARSRAALPALRVPYSMFTLGNGLKVIVHEDHALPIIAVNTWFHVGSGDEKPGRTGFAHLFEHIMFMGSQHVPTGEFDKLLEAAGADNNGSTTQDRTNYYEDGPSNALPLMLWLDSDRMGHLLPEMTAEKVDLQRGVVQNERRQSYENQPYGLAMENILKRLFPPTHPYHWPVIGSMADLSAASLEDVRGFFRTWYTPNNAVIAIAGDIDSSAARALAERDFGAIPRGPAVTRPAPPPFALDSTVYGVLEDRVQVPRVYVAWHAPKAYAPDDAALDAAAEILGGGKSSRLYRRLVYELQIATNANAYQNGMRLDGMFGIVATARP